MAAVLTRPAWVVVLQVEVLGPDGKPIPEAKTRVYSTETKAFPVATSATGTYGLPAGKYTVTAVAPGYIPQDIVVELAESKDQSVKITLQPSPWWREFLSGAKTVVWPSATDTTTNVFTKWPKDFQR
jgi:hypothetical protein